MNNPDILFQIALRLSDVEMSKLIVPQFWPAIQSVYSNERFWYERAMFVAQATLVQRLQVDWRRIYYSIVHNSYLDYLPSMQVYFELSWDLEWDSKKQEAAWEEVSCPKVLEQLLQTGFLTPSKQYIRAAMYESMRRRSLCMIAPLIALAEQIGCSRLEEEGVCLELAIREATVIEVRYMLASYPHLHSYRPALESAISKDKLDMVLEIGGNAGHIFSLACNAGSVSVVSAYLDKVASPNWNDLAYSAARNNQSKFLQYVLTKYDPTVELTSLLSHCKSSTASVLLRDTRVQIDRLAPDTIALFMSHLGNLAVDKIRGFVLGESLSRTLCRENALRCMSRGTIYSLCLRMLVLKQATGSEIVDWMIEARDMRLSKLADEVLNDSKCSDVEMVPLYYLISHLLTPKRGLQAILDSMRTTGYAMDVVSKAARLIGAYNGSNI